jgi:hypothetical protein
MGSEWGTNSSIYPNLSKLYTYLLSNGHQIRENGELLVRMCRGESHFSQKWPVGESGEYSVNGLANVGEFGESAQQGSANVGEFGKFGESAQHGLANVGESGESAQHGLANVGSSAHDKIGRF